MRTLMKTEMKTETDERSSTVVDTAMLRAEAISLGYGQVPVVRDLTLEIAAGELTSIIGPNGCGKSTLLRGLGRLLKPVSGQVYLDGKSISTIPTRQVATRLSVLPQTPVAPSGLTVADLVGRGRHPRQRWYQQFSRSDEFAVREALEATDIADLADAPMEELSGGQQQRAWISMVLAQESEILLLDEPTTFLDLAHQVEVLQLVERLNRDFGRTIVMVLHDISLAARYSSRIIAMKNGSIIASGTPAEVVTAERLFEVFGLRATVVPEPATGRPHVIPLGTGHQKPSTSTKR